MNTEDISRLITKQVTDGQVRFSQHAQQEMTDEGITVQDVLQCLLESTLLENYPSHKRGACCLIMGWTHTGRPVHVVCSTHLDILVIITVYMPLPPKWVTPSIRRRK